MKSILILALCAVTVSTVGSAIQAQSPEYTRPIMPCPSCGGGGGSTGGGGGGVGGTNPTPVTSWGSFTSPSTSGSHFSAGGTSQREGLSTAVEGGTLYLARTDTNIVDSGGDAAVFVSTSSTGIGYGIDYGRQVVTDNGVSALAASNPALAVDGIAGGNLYLAWIDGYGALHYVVSSRSPNGSELVDWGQQSYSFIPVNGSQAVPLIYSPSIAVLGNTVYISALSGADRSLWLGRFPVGQPYNITWSNFPADTDIGMSPGLGVFNNTLYIAFPANDNSHNLYYYTTTDGQNLTFQTGAGGDQSSTTPSLVAYKGLLYMAFRTNDGDHKFIYKYSSDGINWSGSISLSGVAMGGPPSLADGTSLTSDPGHLINSFVANDPSLYLYSGESN